MRARPTTLDRKAKTQVHVFGGLYKARPTNRLHRSAGAAGEA